MHGVGAMTHEWRGRQAKVGKEQHFWVYQLSQRCGLQQNSWYRLWKHGEWPTKLERRPIGCQKPTRVGKQRGERTLSP